MDLCIKVKQMVGAIQSRVASNKLLKHVPAKKRASTGLARRSPFSKTLCFKEKK